MTTKTFKEKNPDYFKNYYKNNIAKFQERNKNRNRKKYMYQLKLNGQIYTFSKKSDIIIERISVQ